MLITIYKVTQPKVIEEFVDSLEYSNTDVVVKVDMMAICKADIRYFLGNRSQDVLNHKYPLAPIHEAVGTVIKDPTGTYKVGDKVILVPNFVDEKKCVNCLHERCKEKELGNNYCPYAKFKSSSCDGFMRPFYACPQDQLVKYDSNVPANIAVWSELLSVSYAMTRRIDFSKTKNIALFGDGIMGYITYIILTRLYKKEVTVFGIDDDKLKMFEGAKTYHFEDYVGRPFDTLIEAVGGRASGFAINNMIDLASIGADLILMGVSEENVPLCTRKVLEKGLSLKGVTRSSIDDFKAISELLSIQDVQKDLEKLILSEITIKSVNDVYKAFELDINNTKLIGKNLMKF